MNKSEKSHNTGLRILEVLLLLLNENISRNDIIEKLKLNTDIDSIYASETLLKYFNTIKLLGFDIKKSGIKYSLNNALFQTEFNSEERKILIKLINFCAKYYAEKDQKYMKNILFKLDKYTGLNSSEYIDISINKEKIKEGANKKNSILKSIKNILNDEQNVSITYQKNKEGAETLTVLLKGITEKKNNVIINCFDSATGKNKNIKLDAIISLKQQPSKNTGIRIKNSVVFSIYDRLALTYKLKPSEKVVDFSENHMTISNSEEDKETLFLRLLKYGENCKIISPEYVKDEFVAFTDEILKNLEG